MSEEVLEQFKADIANIKSHAKKLGCNEQEIHLLFEECFNDLKNESKSSKLINGNKAQNTGRRFRYIFSLFLIFAIFIYILLNVHHPTSSIVLRNVQGLTYPTLKIIRFLSVPIIKIFPSLTDLYDESCLVENPYFYVADMECWPCENVNTVLNLTNESIILKSASGSPFIVKTNQQLVTLKTLQALYNENKVILQLEKRRIKLINSNVDTLEDLFDHNQDKKLSSTSHILWRINKMLSARIVRKIFPKPFFLPERTGESMERFVIINGPKALPYLLPNTECSYVYVIQASGARTIILKPSMECGGQCKTVSVVLEQSYVLWYNWWYWRPISLPMKNVSATSVTYINSYC